MPALSVIICTHNPRPDYLARVLDAMKGQTLRATEWELIVVDNASDLWSSSTIDLAWHPAGRVVREETLGLIPARLRGIREAIGTLLVFVDDDNVLSRDYLTVAKSLAERFPWLGAIGGQILPRYEVPPPDWFTPYERALAIRHANRAVWSNNLDDWKAQPWGAGMVVRANVCERYREVLVTDPRRASLGRRDQALMSGEDVDLTLTSLDLGLGFGVFPELIVTHLIPPLRTNEEYLLRIMRGHSTSGLLLRYLRGEEVPERTERRSLYTELRRLFHYLTMPSIQRRIEKATLAGEDDFDSMVRDYKNNNDDGP